MEKYQKIVVSGLLINQNKALLIKRSLDEQFLPNYYELPGGKVDFAEDPELALKREFQEETGLEIEIIRLFATQSYLMENNNRHTVEIFYQVKLIGNEQKITLSPDHSDYQWLTSEEINQHQITPELKHRILLGME